MSIKGKFIKKGKSILGTDKPDNLGDFLEEKETLNASMTGGIYDVPVDQVKSNPYQPRKYFDETALAELSESIKQNGVIQPIVIRQGDNNNPLQYPIFRKAVWL